MNVSDPPRSDPDANQEATTATIQEITGQPWSVASRLTERLAWSLSTAHHYRHLLEAPPE